MKRIVKFTTILLFFCFGVNESQATNVDETLRSELIKVKVGEAIPGALVFNENLQRGIATEREENINFDPRATGKYVLKINSFGYVAKPNNFYLTKEVLGRKKTQVDTGSIVGKITADGEPVVGANVGIPEIQKGDATDENGVFEIRDVPAGNYQLQVSSVSYGKVTKRIMVVAGETLTVDMQMKESHLQLDQVVVTGTMRRTYVKESPVKVSVVQSEMLQQGRISANVMDLINSVNGLTTQLNCAVCGTNAIRINGVEGANTAVLIDGMPIMGALASVYGLNGISPSIIDQVEVVKGPQSTLYGTQALGGVVNIITKNPATTPTFSADAYARSTEEGNVNVAYAPKIGRFEGLLSGNVLRLENFLDQNDDNFNDLVKQSRVSMFGKGTLAGKNMEERFSVVTKYYYEDRTGGLPDFRDNLRGTDQIYGESIYTNRFELLTEYRPAGLDERLRINGAFTYHDQDSYYGTDWYDAQQGIYFLQGVWDQSIGQNIKLLSGTTIRYETYNDNTPATSEGVDKRWIPGIFSQGELAIGDVTFVGGLRIDHHSEHGFVPAPRLATKYRPTDLTTFRASAGTGFRVVNVFTEDHAALTGSREVVFNEDLEPEKSRSITASLEQIIPFGVNPMTISLDGFYTHFSNQIIPDYDQDPNLIAYENLDGFSVTRGFSVNLDQNFTAIPLSYNAGITVMDVFTEEDGVQQALAYAPEYVGAFGATYDVRSLGLSVGYNGNLVGQKRLPDGFADFGRDTESPAYFTHDIRVTKEFTDVNSQNGIGFETFVSAENLTDFTQGSPLIDPQNPFGPNFDTAYTWGPVIGRTFSLGVRLNIR